MQQSLRLSLNISVALIISNTLHAGSFSLYTEGSTVAVGNYAAGIAAEAADASIGWYNPAGLVLMKKQQLILGGVGVFPSTQLSGNSTFSTENVPAYEQSFSKLQAGKKALVPALHYARPLNDRLTLGLSIVSPFGLSTEYADSSPVRYAATFTQLLTANVAPALGVRLTDNFSLGAGLDLQWARVKFNRVLGSPAQLQALQQGGLAVTPTSFDSTSNNEGHSFGVGFHVGALTMFNDNHTRVGLNYQSKMNHTFHGSSELTGPLADPDLENPQATYRTNNLSSNNMQLPNVITLSAYQDVTQKVALLGSIVYTGWDVFKVIQLNNVAAYSAESAQTIPLNVSTNQDYRNVWRFALGANYQVNEQWMMRAGGGYDQTPTINAYRDVRLPDSDRWALSIGTHYQMSPALGFDVGYSYLFASHAAKIHTDETLNTESSYAINASSKAHAQLLGVQAVWTIG